MNMTAFEREIISEDVEQARRLRSKITQWVRGDERFDAAAQSLILAELEECDDIVLDWIWTTASAAEVIEWARERSA